MSVSFLIPDRFSDIFFNKYCTTYSNYGGCNHAADVFDWVVDLILCIFFLYYAAYAFRQRGSFGKGFGLPGITFCVGKVCLEQLYIFYNKFAYDSFHKSKLTTQFKLYFTIYTCFYLFYLLFYHQFLSIMEILETKFNKYLMYVIRFYFAYFSIIISIRLLFSFIPNSKFTKWIFHYRLTNADGIAYLIFYFILLTYLTWILFFSHIKDFFSQSMLLKLRVLHVLCIVFTIINLPITFAEKQYHDKFQNHYWVIMLIELFNRFNNNVIYLLVIWSLMKGHDKDSDSVADRSHSINDGLI